MISIDERAYPEAARLVDALANMQYSVELGEITRREYNMRADMIALVTRQTQETVREALLQIRALHEDYPDPYSPVMLDSAGRDIGGGL